MRLNDDETKVYFFENDKVMRLDLNSRETENLYYLPDNRTKVLFYDCERIAFSYGMFDDLGWVEYKVIKNFVTGDSLKISGSEFPIYVLVTSPNDKLLYQQTAIDGTASGVLFYTQTLNLFMSKIYGKGMGKFTDEGKYFYGILGDQDSPNYSAVAIDLNTKEKIIIKENLNIKDIYDINLKIGFNTLSYSEDEGILLYSLMGDIKVYNFNTKRSYNFIVTDSDERAARFINVN